MKKTFLFLLTTIFLSSCNRDDNKNNTLPPATQTGVGTFACYVNGKAFVDKNSPPHAYYQLVDGGYYFHIGGTLKKGRVEGLYGISIGTMNKTISENETLTLNERQEYNAWGEGGFSLPDISYTLLTTSIEHTGELTITKLDFEKQIVSGTFWFDLKNPRTGERVEIREGRFDTLFTHNISF